MPERPFLLAVGDLYVQKNYRRLIEALTKVRRTRPDLPLRIAGAALDPDQAAELRELAAAHGPQGAVTFLGRCDRDALIDLYRGCAAFVFPSLEESFGMPLVEAMACGAPVIAARCAATPEITAGAAVLFDPDDPDDIADAILRVLEDPDLLAALRRQSLARAAEFSWQECARRTAAVLRDAAA